MWSNPAQAGQWSTRTWSTSTARVYVPDGESPIGSGRSLLVALHGCTQSAADLEQRGNFEAAAEEFGMVVALPDVPLGGVIAGCWDYYGGAHTRSNRHNGFVLSLTQELRDDPELKVDIDQVYIAGLSSGAGEALVLSCLAPELYAGVGVVQGPAVGTEASEIALVATTASSAAQTCLALAQSESPRFADQLAVVYTASADFIVNQEYAELNAAMYAQLYVEPGVSMGVQTLDYAAFSGYEPVGQAHALADDGGPRIALLRAQGPGHAWPAGSGPGPELSFVAAEGVNFSAFVAEFFAANARRTDPLGPDPDPDPGETDGDPDPTSSGTDGDDESSTTDVEPGDAGTGSSPGEDPETDSSDPDPVEPAADTEPASGCRLVPRRAPAAAVFLAWIAAMRRRRSSIRGSAWRGSSAGRPA